MPTPNNGFVIVGRQIKTEFAEDTYPVAEDLDLLGGFQVLPSLARVQAIPQARLKVYMLAVDGSTGTIYQYVPNLSAPPNFIWQVWQPWLVSDVPQVVAAATGSQTPNFTFKNFEYVMTGNVTIANAINVMPGQVKRMQFRQDGTGSLTVSWGGAYDTAGFTLRVGVLQYTEAVIYCDSSGVLHVRGS